MSNLHFIPLIKYGETWTPDDMTGWPYHSLAEATAAQRRFCVWKQKVMATSADTTAGMFADVDRFNYGATTFESDFKAECDRLQVKPN